MNNSDTLYSRWLAGELSPSEIEALKSSGEWEELQSIIEATEKLRVSGLDLDASYQKLKSRTQQAKTGTVRLQWKWVAAAAAVVLLLISTVLWLRRSTIVRADLATNMEYQFEDASSVLLNDGSNIRYNRRAWAEDRMVFLMGEALFDVEPGKPFTVKTKSGTVKVLGTLFNVRNWGENLYVECYSGSVEVTRENQSVKLVKGQSINFRSNQPGEVTSITNLQPLWTNGQSYFVDENIKTVLEEIGRQFNIEVVSPKTARNFTGVFPHDNLERALDMVCKPMGLNYKIATDRTQVNVSQ